MNRIPAYMSGEQDSGSGADKVEVCEWCQRPGKLSSPLLWQKRPCVLYVQEPAVSRAEVVVHSNADSCRTEHLLLCLFCPRVGGNQYSAEIRRLDLSHTCSSWRGNDTSNSHRGHRRIHMERGVAWKAAVSASLAGTCTWLCVSAGHIETDAASQLGPDSRYSSQTQSQRSMSAV